jgi:hypothetical protein
MRLLGFGEGLEPLGDLLEAFFACGARHPRIHIGVFVSLAGNGRYEILRSAADRFARYRIADLLEVFEMAMRVAGLTFCGRAKYRRDVVGGGADPSRVELEQF